MYELIKSEIHNGRTVGLLVL